MKTGIVLPAFIAFLLSLSNAAPADDLKNRDRSFEQDVTALEGNPLDPGLGGMYESAAVDTYCIVWYSFETMNWQGWTRENNAAGYPSYSGLANGLVDYDPCGDNLTTQIVFFLGSREGSREYPMLYDTPSCAGPGAVSAPCQDEMVVSPIIDLKRYSTRRNESQDAAIPASDVALLGGCQVRFTVYRDLPLPNLVFYAWHVRMIHNARPGPWLDRNLLYYGGARDYAFIHSSIGDLVTGDSIQIALEAVDMCGAWYGIHGNCSAHTPAPWFDSVRLYRYKSSGPQWSYRDIDLFQDNFPSDELDVESYVRADAARDVNAPSDPAIRPGDSVVVFCDSPLGGGIATENGRPAVFMNVRCTYVGASPAKPPLSGAVLQGSYGMVVSSGGWTIIQGEAARRGAEPVPSGYMFDLNDSLLTRGYMVEYYFTARDNAGIETALPKWALSTSLYFEFTCLPTGKSDILFVDGASGRGSFHGAVDDYWNPVFRAVLPSDNLPDKYDVNGPTSGVSNGLASRAKTRFLSDTYTTIIWDSGDLRSFTIGNGGPNGDKSDDCRMLVDWIQTSQHPCGLWLCGDNMAEELDAFVTPSSRMLMDRCGVELAAPSYFNATGGPLGAGVVTPLVSGSLQPGLFAHGGVPDKFYTYGGCFVINSFDCLEKSGDGSYALDYPAYQGRSYHAGISTCGANPAGYRVKTLWFGFSYMFVRDDVASMPEDRFEIAHDVFTWMASYTGDGCDFTRYLPPKQPWVLQNTPNPFNPSSQATTVSFALHKGGYVEIKIYDVSGRLVRTLVKDSRLAGIYGVPWDGKNDRGSDVPSGIYFYRMKTGVFKATKKMVLVR